MTDPRIEAVKTEIGHYSCEDTWYSCPLSPEGTVNENIPKGVCTCGVDDRAARLLAVADDVDPLRTEPDVAEAIKKLSRQAGSVMDHLAGERDEARAERDWALFDCETLKDALATAQASEARALDALAAYVALVERTWINADNRRAYDRQVAVENAQAVLREAGR